MGQVTSLLGHRYMDSSVLNDEGSSLYRDRHSSANHELHRGKTMYWDSATDSLGCQDISIAAATQITGS